MTDQEKIAAIKRHADAFLQSGMWSWSGYFPDDFYGKEARKYYLWSKKAYELMKALGD